MTLAKSKLAGFIGIALLVIGTLYVVSVYQARIAGASTVNGQGYNATSTIDASWPSASAFKQIKKGQGMLGSIVIASTSPAVTTTNSNNKVSLRCFDSSVSTTTASSTLVVVGDQAAAGTYVFDVNFSAGLICEALPGFAGGYTITWKSQ